MARTDVAWWYLPHDFPPHTAVYGYFKEWERHGTAEQIHDTLRDQLRRKKGRRILPSAAIIDAQSVKASPNAPESSQGFDGGYKSGMYEEPPDRSRSMIHWAMVNSMITRLTASPDKVGRYLRPKPRASA